MELLHFMITLREVSASLNCLSPQFQFLFYRIFKPITTDVLGLLLHWCSMQTLCSRDILLSTVFLHLHIHCIAIPSHHFSVKFLFLFYQLFNHWLQTHDFALHSDKFPFYFLNRVVKVTTLHILKQPQSTLVLVFSWQTVNAFFRLLSIHLHISCYHRQRTFWMTHIPKLSFQWEKVISLPSLEGKSGYL